MHKNSSRLALLAGLAAMTVPTSAFAIGTTAFETEPAQPVPGQPFTIVAQPNNVTGAVTYAWDLDMDGVCETAPSANPRITLPARPQGYWPVTSCVADEVSSINCRHDVIVGPKPRLQATPEEVLESRFLKDGATVKVTWNVPVTNLRVVSADYSPFIPDGTASTFTPLDAPTLDRAADGSWLVHVPAPPAGSFVPWRARGARPWVSLNFDLRDDPNYGRYGLSSPYGGGLFNLVQTLGSTGGGSLQARNPGIGLRVARRGNRVSVAISPGKAVGRRVLVALRSPGIKPRRKKVLLRRPTTRFTWRLSAPALSVGELAVSIDAHFVKDGVRYSTRKANGALQSRTLRWR